LLKELPRKQLQKSHINYLSKKCLFAWFGFTALEKVMLYRTLTTTTYRLVERGVGWVRMYRTLRTGFVGAESRCQIMNAIKLYNTQYTLTCTRKSKYSNISNIYRPRVFIVLVGTYWLTDILKEEKHTHTRISET